MLHLGCALGQLGKVPCARADERVVLLWRLPRCEQKPRRTQADTCAPRFHCALHAQKRAGVGAGSAYSQGCQATYPTCIIGGGRDPHAQWERLNQPLVRLHIQRAAAGQHLHVYWRLCQAVVAYRRRRARQGSRITKARIYGSGARFLCAVMAVPTRTAKVCCGGQRQRVFLFAGARECSRVGCAG